MTTEAAQGSIACSSCELTHDTYFKEAYPDTYERIKYFADVHWQEQREKWDHIESNLNEGIYQKNKVPDSDICPTTNLLIETAAYNDLLISRNSAGVLFIQHALTGEVLKEISADYFRIHNGILYTSLKSEKPVLTLFNLDSLEQISSFSLSRSVHQDQVEYLLQHLFFHSGAPLAVYKILPPVIGSSSDVLITEYLIVKLNSREFLLLEHPGDQFFLVGNTLFVVSSHDIATLDVDNFPERTEQYNSLVQQILRCSSPPMFLMMPDRLLLIRLEQKVLIWDLERNERFSETLKLSSPGSILRYEAGILYEFNQTYIRILDSKKIQPLAVISLDDFEGDCDVNLTLFDNKLFLQLIGNESNKHRLRIYQYPTIEHMITLQGILMSELPGFPKEGKSVRRHAFRKCFHHRLPFFPEGQLILKSADEEALIRYDFGEETQTSNTPAIIGLGIGVLAVMAIGYFAKKN